MKAAEVMDAQTTYLVLYRIKKTGGIGTPGERRQRLTDELAKLNGDRAGRFFEEAGHISTSAWTVRIPASTKIHDFVQKLKVDAKLSAGIDYLWAIEIVVPVNQAHLTKEAMPDAGAKAAATKAVGDQVLGRLKLKK